MKIFPQKSLPVSVCYTAILAGVLFFVALLIQAVSQLPSQYSWLRTVELFWHAIKDKYFVVMAFFVLLTTMLNRKEKILLFDADFDSDPVHNGLAAALTTVAVIALIWTPGSYSNWDYFFLLPSAILFFYFLRAYHLGHFIIGLLISLIALMIVSYVFTIFKSQLFLRGVILDSKIVGGEIFLFGEPLYALIADWASKHLLVVRFSDWVYYLFFHHMALIALFLFATGNKDEQLRYVSSLSLCYLVGGLSYYIFPALGPAYYDPAQFAYLSENAKFTSYIQGFLLRSTDLAVQGHLSKIDTFAFIACMPSLHMAHESIMLFYSRRSSAMMLFSGLFWLSSFVAVLVLGWHYFFDVIGGIILAIIVIFLVHHYQNPVSTCYFSKNMSRLND